eukprot:TRINITY_DN717_c0_g2_i1.p1 TRINITY_DN717_c0_g2~~TRINITY_DN717_c0_g2_i1.p1  ORF type:complete len:416 (+),score=59.78 TRINITY_DN717_c0_g2_i1:46-1248(+)
MHLRTSQPQRRSGARPLTATQPHYQPIIAAAVEGFIPRAPDAYSNLKAFAAPEKSPISKACAPLPADHFVPVTKPQPSTVTVAEPLPVTPIPKVELGPALATFLRTCLDDDSLVRSEVTAHQAHLVCSGCQQPMVRRRRVQDGVEMDGFLFRCRDCGIISVSGHTLPTIEGDLARAATNSPLLLSNGRPEPKQLLFVVDGEAGTTVLDPVTLMFREAGLWDRSYLYRVVKADDVAVELEPANIPKAEGLIATNITVKRNGSGDLEIRVNPLRPARQVKWRLPVKGAQIGEFIEKLQRRDPMAIPVWFQVDAASGRQTLVQLEGTIRAAIEDPTNAPELFDAVSAAVVARGWFLEPLQPGSPPGTERVPLVDKSARAHQLRSVLSGQLGAYMSQEFARASA